MSSWLWVVAIASGGVWFALKRENKLNKITIVRWINFVLFTLAMLSLLFAPWGSLGNIAEFLAWVVGSFLSLFGEVATGLAIAFFVVALVMTGIDLLGRKKDKVARFGVVIIPVLALVIGGPLGSAIENGVGSVGTGSASLVHSLSNGK